MAGCSRRLGLLDCHDDSIVVVPVFTIPTAADAVAFLHRTKQCISLPISESLFLLCVSWHKSMLGWFLAILQTSLLLPTTQENLYCSSFCQHAGCSSSSYLLFFCRQPLPVMQGSNTSPATQWPDFIVRANESGGPESCSHYALL
jgi:hypothetical protein